MDAPTHLMFIHGLISSGQGDKATFLRTQLPGLLTPDFSGTLDQRMAQLTVILGDTPGWTLIGSSFGGLMATLFACQHPAQVRQLILLAPALTWPDFVHRLPPPTDVPTTIYHGRADDVVPLAPTRAIAARLFTRMTFHEVDDGHDLYATVRTLDWPGLLEGDHSGWL